MKKLILTALFILVTACFTFAGQKQLTALWEYDNATIHGIAGFNLYYSTSVLPDNCTNACPLLVNIPYVDGVTTYSSPPVYFSSPDGEETLFYFGMTAYDHAGNESLTSEQATYLVDFKAPPTPFNFSVVITDVP